MQSRPDPDDLLKAIQDNALERGRLKVFLGASAGVGKTFAMLSEAHEQKRRGVDVVIGYIETHGRHETQALVEGLELIDLAEIEYHGATLREVNVEAIKARRPELVLVDELAHTNAPGSRHTKRWQDVEDLLIAGIDVFTAINIQHLESLNDVVAQVTRVRVSETVPDAFIEQANSIELIDIPPTELQQRLKEGKVYIPDRVEQALDGFFKTSNLTALRELALRRAADTVDAEMRRLRTQEGAAGPWATRERVVVCVAPNRMAPRVVRAAARLGAASHAELIALYVESDRQTGRTLEQLASAEEALELAAQLGMEVVNLAGHDIVAEVLNFANRRNATLVVVGKPIRARWKELLFGSVVDELVRASGDIDVHVITGSSVETAPVRVSNSTGHAVTSLGIALIVASAAISTGISFLIYEGFGIANSAMVYVLGVSIIALRTTRLESIAAAVVNVLCFNFFFVDPRYTFAVSDVRFLLLFFVMLSVAVVISSLTHRLRAQLAAASDRERRTSSLYSLSRQLAQGRGKREMARSAAKEIRDVFEGDVSIMLTDGGTTEILSPSETSFESQPSEAAVAGWVAEHGLPAGHGTDTLPGARALYLPLKGSEATVGILAFLPYRDFTGFAHRQLLETFGNTLGLALERAVLAKASNDARVLAESERIRSTLLSSISHDLRTPLTSITGAASSLMNGSPNGQELATTIYQESIRLNHQIQNLLDMTRLQSGNVEPNFEWHTVEELVASAVRGAATSLGTRTVEVKSEPGLPMLWADGLLLEKALVNLLENVGRHTGAQDAVSIESCRRDRFVEICVRDQGPGLPESPANKVFEPGQRTAAGGYGLGLAVVKAVMDLHDGSVTAANAPGGGAAITLAIPLPDHQPEPPHE